MWLVWEDRLHGWVWCAIRACVRKGEATGRGALRWEGAFKGSREHSERLLGWGQYVGLGRGLEERESGLGEMSGQFRRGRNYRQSDVNSPRTLGRARMTPRYAFYK